MVRDRLPGGASAGLLDWLRGTASDDATERSDRAADGQEIERDEADRPERAADEPAAEVGDARPDVVDATASPRSRPSAGSRRAVADGSGDDDDGSDGREWTEDDPIQFGVDDGADDQSLLEAVTPASDDASLSGETAVLAGGLGVETRDAASEESTDDERGGSGVASGDAPATDASDDRSAAPAGESQSVGQSAKGNDDGAQLPDRVAGVADEQESVATNVEALESEVEGLHGELESVRSDLETLVTLVKQTAPTRGGAAATDPSEAVAESSGAEAESSDVEAEQSGPEAEQSPAGGAPRASEGPTSPADPEATDRTPAGDASASDGSPGRARDAPNHTRGAPDCTPDAPERTSDGAASPSSAVDESGDEADDEPGDETAIEGDRASSAEDTATRSEADPGASERSPIDPRSDEVEARLRTYRERFDRAPDEGEHVSLERLGRGVDDGRTAGDGDGASGANGSGASEANGDDASEANGSASGVNDGTSGASGEAGTDDGEDDAVEHDFEFAKVLVPPDGDGTPDVAGDDTEQPYLEALPEGVAAEAAVIEWLDGIVSTADQAGAVQAVEFYESIDWITADVRDELLGYLKGVGPVDETASPTRPPEELELADHRRSLEYVTGLANGEVTADGI